MSDQDCQRQIDELQRVGCHHVHTDEASGKNMNRPGWKNLWRDVREGDTVVVLSVDRLGRDVLQILQTVEGLQQRGIGLKVLSGDIDTGTVSGRLVLNILASLAQWERDLIVERSVHGLAKARARGIIGGRPPKITEAVMLDTIRRLDAREALKDIAASYKVSPKTLSRKVGVKRKLLRAEGKEA